MKKIEIEVDLTEQQESLLKKIFDDTNEDGYCEIDNHEDYNICLLYERGLIEQILDDGYIPTRLGQEYLNS